MPTEKRDSWKWKPQFHCSNRSGLCDRCGRRLQEHVTGDYYCPAKRDFDEGIDWNTDPHVRRN